MLVIRLFKFVALLVTGLLLILMALVLLMIERKPLVISNEQISPEVALQAEQLRQRSKRALLSSQLELSADEANALIIITRRVYPQVNGRINIANQQLLAAISIPVFNQRFFINVSGIVLPSNHQLQFAYVQVGDLKLPGNTAINVLRWFGDWYLGAGQATQLLASVQQVNITEDRVRVNYLWPQQLELSQLMQLRDSKQLYGSPKVMQYYYQVLVRHPVQGKTESLATYLQVLFREAAAQTNLKSGADAAIEENRAALLALAVFLGSPKFELVLGNVRGNSKQHLPHTKVTLAQRVDLQSHFVYSAAIKAMTNKDIGYLAGEMKELLDTNPNGSGFSFADLMADQAGVRFAELALQSEESARDLQQKVSLGLTEQQLLPDISAMPEGVDYQAFRDQYDTVNSVAYRDMLAFIKQELDALPLYQGF